MSTEPKPEPVRTRTFVSRLNEEEFRAFRMRCLACGDNIGVRIRKLVLKDLAEAGYEVEAGE